VELPTILSRCSSPRRKRKHFNQRLLQPPNDGTLYASTLIDRGIVLRFALQKITTTAVTNGNPLLTLSALPGQAYLLQSSTSVSATVWQTLSTNVADSNGLLQFLDTTGSGMPARYYRTALY
jgi:hypothetical protein